MNLFRFLYLKWKNEWIHLKKNRRVCSCVFGHVRTTLRHTLRFVCTFMPIEKFGPAGEYMKGMRPSAFVNEKIFKKSFLSSHECKNAKLPATILSISFSPSLPNTFCVHLYSNIRKSININIYRMQLLFDFASILEGFLIFIYFQCNAL